MNYRHQFEVNAPLKQVVAFHTQSNSMAAITPPPIIIKIHRTPPTLNQGDEMDFTLWLGPFPIHWVARIEDVTPTSFADRQIHGPFKHWLHRHTFISLSPNSTQVIDEIEFTLRPHPLWGLVSLNMVLGLPFLFGYRGWKTKRLLGS